MKKIIILPFIILLINTINVWGDDQQRIIPPSPQAQQFMKYIDYPVDYSSGLPKVEIPIYTIQSGSLTLPISISYHTSGLKPSEDTGFIGLGWNLNYGGIISRTMKGYPDEKYLDQTIKNENNFIGSSNYLVEDTDYSYLYNIAIASKDVELDIFNYTLPNQSGRFIFQRGSSLNISSRPVLLPYHPVKILPHMISSGVSSYIDYFDVLDEEGIQYRFGKSLSESKEEFESYELQSSPTGWQHGVTGWLLTEIISADKSDTISFEYDFVKESALQSNWIEKRHKVFHGSYSDCLGGGSFPYIDSGNRSTSISSYVYSTKRIKLIKFNEGEIRFSYKSDYYPNSLLEEIELFDKASNSVIKTITFDQSKYHTNNSLLNWDKLDAINFYDKNLLHIKEYNFSYNTSVSFPVINDTDTNESYSVDHWGYYNGASNNTLLPPLSDLPANADALQYLTGTANRNPNANFMKAGILTQITYPTGGSVSFVYKGNKNGYENIGGLCLDYILSQSGNEQIKKTFSYSNPVGVNHIEDIYYYSQSMTWGSNFNVYANYSTSSDIVTNINLNNRPIIYTSVTEYLGDQTTNSGKIVHEYDSSILSNYLSSDNIQFNMECYPLTLVEGWNNAPKNYYQRYLNYGELFEKETTFYDSFNNIKKILKKYYSHNTVNSYDGLSIKQQVMNYAGRPNKTCHFLFATYTINQLKQKLDSIKEYTYSSTDQTHVELLKKFEYNDYLLMNKSISLNSNDETIETKYYYPPDYNSVSNFSILTEKNIIGKPVDVRTYNGTKLISGQQTEYNNYGQPIKLYNFESNVSDILFSLSDPYTFTHKVSYTYDSTSKRIRDEKPVNDSNTAYLWDYSRSYLMAKVVNAYYSQISSQDGKVCTYNSETLYNSLSSLVTGGYITTYSYKPLVGMASQTDPNGVTTYYSYDDFGRLKLIKNDDSHIQNKYQYNYKQ